MRRSPLARTAMKKKPTREPAELTAARVVVHERSGGWCEIETDVCTHRATQVHHRKHRRHGDHRPIALLDSCDACHDYTHRFVELSYERGWLVRSHDDPGLVAVVGRSATREPRSPQNPGVGVGGQQT